MPSVKRLLNMFRTRATHEVVSEIVRLFSYRIDHLAYRMGTGRMAKNDHQRAP